MIGYPTPAPSRPATPLWRRLLILAAVVIVSAAVGVAAGAALFGHRSAASAESTAAVVTMPTLTGENGASAPPALTDAGVTSVPVFKDVTGKNMVVFVDNWVVVSQDPTPGATLHADDPVRVVVTHEPAPTPSGGNIGTIGD